jgi:hypothetical protein
MKAKSFKVTVEADWYEVLDSRKKAEGITLDFQLREAVKMYVEAIKKKGGAQ